MGWLATDHELHSFITFHQYCFQVQSQKGKFLAFFWGHAPRHPNRSMLSVIHTLCKLGRHFQTPLLKFAAMYDNIHDMGMIDATWNLNQAPTLIDFLISACYSRLANALLGNICCEGTVEAIANLYSFCGLTKIHI